MEKLDLQVQQVLGKLDLRDLKVKSDLQAQRAILVPQVPERQGLLVQLGCKVHPVKLDPLAPKGK